MPEHASHGEQTTTQTNSSEYPLGPIICEASLALLPLPTLRNRRQKVPRNELNPQAMHFCFPCLNLMYFPAQELWGAETVPTSVDSAHPNVLLAHLSRVHQLACERKGCKPHHKQTNTKLWVSTFVLESIERGQGTK